MESKFPRSNLFLALSVVLTAGCNAGSLDVSDGADAGFVFDEAVSDSSQLDQGMTLRDLGSEFGDMPTAADDGGAPPLDTGGSPDAGEPDAGRSCPEVACGSGASCIEAVCVCDPGLLGDPWVSCASNNPCEGVTCPGGASCSADGTCGCDPFFSGDPNQECIPTAPASDLAARTTQEVCDLWQSSHARSSLDFFLIEPTSECDPGVLHPDEMREALHTTSKYRMLVGLYPVSLAQSVVDNQQECATMHEAQGSGLSHEPPPSWACYTSGAASAAGSSNLAGGVRNPAGTVGLYVGDRGVPSLGHRRWIFNPGMGITAFGHRGSYGCMYSFGRGRNHSVEFVAYPSPGPFPRAALQGQWSIHGGASWSDGHQVVITRLSDMADVPVSGVNNPVFGNLASTLAWTVSANAIEADVDHRISILDAGGATVLEYVTRLVSCP